MRDSGGWSVVVVIIILITITIMITNTIIIINAPTRRVGTTRAAELKQILQRVQIELKHILRNVSVDSRVLQGLALEHEKLSLPELESSTHSPNPHMIPTNSDPPRK